MIRVMYPAEAGYQTEMNRASLHDVPSLRRMRRGPTLASTSVVHYLVYLRTTVPITDWRKLILLYAALAYNL
jgi:uncharacterized membrane protein YkvA (DUF1232 family)